jgi:NAD(P)-dependent dehydrogenase (short-subunit alcohol dehydrogenase family)
MHGRESRSSVAIVTGAARRIGAAIARRLAAEGFSLVLHTSPASKEEGEAEAERIRKSGGGAIAIACDLVGPDPSSILFSAAERGFGPVTLLINNASFFEPDRAGDFFPDVFERHMAVNVRAPLLLAQEMQRRLPADRQGAIVNIIDQRVLRPNPMYFTYSISKSALWAATITMAQAFAPRMRVNAIGPGPVFPNAYDDAGAAFAEETAALPLKRAASIEDVCDAVVYLAKASSVTGQLIAVDGGQHIAWETPDILALNPRSAGDGS